MKIYIGADHRGFKLKEKIKEWLEEWGYEYEDMGALEYDKDDDYPDFATAVATAVALSPSVLSLGTKRLPAVSLSNPPAVSLSNPSKGNAAKGILICGSGIGMTVVANKVKGIIAGTMMNSKQTRASVSDENTNIIGLSADYSGEEENKQIVKTFLEAEFSGAERHVRRVEKIKKLEKRP